MLEDAEKEMGSDNFVVEEDADGQIKPAPQLYSAP